MDIEKINKIQSNLAGCEKMNLKMMAASESGESPPILTGIWSCLFVRYTVLQCTHPLRYANLHVRPFFGCTTRGVRRRDNSGLSSVTSACLQVP